MAGEPVKCDRVVRVIESSLASSQGCVSSQIVQKFANVACKKFAVKASPAECKAFNAAAMPPTMRMASSTDLLFRAIDLQDELRYGFDDSLVIAATLQAGAGRLYSEDLQHWQRVKGKLRIVHPFFDTVREAALAGAAEVAAKP